MSNKPHAATATATAKKMKVIELIKKAYLICF